jgi:hypothetical protein
VITGKPSGTNLISLRAHTIQRRKCASCR